VTRGWRAAELLPAEDAHTPWAAAGLVPFWMDTAAAVPNNLQLEVWLWGVELGSRVYQGQGFRV